jgi:two-component system cell cycle sensor histidine kinase/response regulator CckA
MKTRKSPSGTDHAELRRLKRKIRTLEAREAERAVVERKLRQELFAFQNTNDGIIVTDLEGRILDMNPAGERLSGYGREEVLGRLPPEAFRWVGDVEAKVKQIFASVLAGGRWSGEIHYTRKDGSEALCEAVIVPLLDDSGAVAGTMGVHKDLTARKRMEAEILKRQKLESAALMASGIAHDFNNLLTAVLGNLSLARKMAARDPDMLDAVDGAEQAARQAADLTGRLLDLARPESPNRSHVDLHEIVQKTVEMTMKRAPVRCDLRTNGSPWKVCANALQISQVVQNLLVNALEAMPRGGSVAVTLENRDVGGEFPLPVKPGRYVSVSVSDQGVGIPPDHLPRIFDPYFTTKQKGSGLGLTTAHAIVKNHEGYLFVESMPRAGTTFTVLLPAAET